MGTYLSSPIVEKCVESGEDLEDPISPLVWGVVDMQGWRKSMEDSHVADTNVDIPPHLRMHSGHDDSKGKVFAVFDGHGGPEVARFCQLYLVDVITKQSTWKEEIPTGEEVSTDPATTPVGQALILAFHALDRMIDSRPRRDELIRLRGEKPQPGERRASDSIPIPPFKPVQRIAPAESAAAAAPPKKEVEEMKDIAGDAKTEDIAPPFHPAEAAADDSEATESPTTDETAGVTTESAETPKEEDDASEDDASEDDASEEDSTAVVAEKDEATDDDLDDYSNGEDDLLEKLPSSTQHMLSSMIESLEGDSGQVVAKLSSEGKAPESTVCVPKPPESTPTPGITATIIQNGRQMCNLPDHPIHAGCTAIVAVLIGRTLTIANAGDSRAVLCRVGGRTEALSFDHKPHQDREMSRITKAGGFVNQFGRVNGNLNLSRSIGDLKYKQIPGLTPAEQMITADPDIIQVTLHPKDEFVVLGCDGIWDCLTNEQAVKYVRDRIDSKTPTEIGTEMLDEIISEDPRATQGIGGDNMTIMVIDLQPSTRAYR